jgi:hypothetical protein
MSHFPPYSWLLAGEPDWFYYLREPYRASVVPRLPPWMRTGSAGDGCQPTRQRAPPTCQPTRQRAISWKTFTGNSRKDFFFIPAVPVCQMTKWRWHEVCLELELSENEGSSERSAARESPDGSRALLERSGAPPEPEHSESSPDLSGGLQGPHQNPGGYRRRRVSAGAEPHRPARRGRGVDRLAGSAVSAGKAGPLPRSAGACRDEGHAESLLRDVLLVRGRLPLRGREAEARRSRGALPARELPAGPALRDRIAARDPIFDSYPPGGGPLESSQARLGRGVPRQRQDRASESQKSPRHFPQPPTSVTSEPPPSIHL